MLINCDLHYFEIQCHYFSNRKTWWLVSKRKKKWNCSSLNYWTEEMQQYMSQLWINMSAINFMVWNLRQCSLDDAKSILWSRFPTSLGFFLHKQNKLPLTSWPKTSASLQQTMWYKLLKCTKSWNNFNFCFVKFNCFLFYIWQH